jgi:GT2 family glycosyltransferase
VVTVTVVHDPGAWFDDVLDGLAEQDFPNLKHLFLLTSEPGDLPARIRQRVPNCFVRAVAGNPGFGPACNEVLSLVEGQNGFFCFLHDDVALEPAAIRVMVEELYRSNAGVVGPKLVLWDDPSVLQHVGIAIDRVGEIDPIVEPGEVDQEQHDAVRDVFAVPSACMLVRADLFRELGGFDPTIAYHGEDVDLCWRAHLSGARVVVVPSARGRHLEQLQVRRPDLAHARLRAQHRVRTVATLTGGRRLPLRLLRLAGLSLVELIVGLFTGTARDGWEALKATVALVGRTPAVIARRRAVAATRRVPDSEVAGLQLGGSARLASYLRSRDGSVFDNDEGERRWRQSAGSLPALAWLALLVLFVIGSRKMISGGVPDAGQMMPFPESPRRMLGDYWSGWRSVGLGSSTAAPTGEALVALGSVLTLFHMGLWRTVTVLGAVLVGYIGMWRVTSLFPTARARVTGLAVYACAPLAAALLAHGRWSALACYAATPWTLHLLRRVVGIDTRGPAGDGDDHQVSWPRRKRVRIAARLVLVVAATAAFVPTFLMLVAGVGLLLAVATVAGGGRWQVAAQLLVATAGALAGSLLLNLPWVGQWFAGTWSASLGVPLIGDDQISLGEVLTFDLASWPLTALSAALFVPVLAAPLLARGWRFTWALRAAALVTGGLAMVVFDDTELLGIRLPEPGMLLVLVALGMAIAAACTVEAFDADVRGQSFGYRQPVALLALLAVGVGVIPGLLTFADGRWDAPGITLQSSLRQLAADGEGDYRVLWIGDPRLMPVAAWEYQAGLAYAITDDGRLELADLWVGEPSDAERDVAAAVRAVASYSTLRGGRLLAPYGIRYVVVPIADDTVSAVRRPLPLPDGLLDALDAQLDLSRPLSENLNFAVYENAAWVPVAATLTPAGAEASRQAGADALARADLSGATAVRLGRIDADTNVQVNAGTLQLAVPFDERWSLTVGGADAAPRPSFGSTTAFDVPTAGTGSLRFDTPFLRRLAVLVQALLWFAAGLAASRFTGERLRRRRRRRAEALEVLPELALSAPAVLPEDLPPGDPVPWATDEQLRSLHDGGEA